VIFVSGLLQDGVRLDHHEPEHRDHRGRGDPRSSNSRNHFRILPLQGGRQRTRLSLQILKEQKQKKLFF
jgi:hypothetical protein